MKTLAVFVLGFWVTSALAANKPHPKPHPNLHSQAKTSWGHMTRAYDKLAKAPSQFNGHRTKAMNLIQEAMLALNQGVGQTAGKSAAVSPVAVPKIAGKHRALQNAVKALHQAQLALEKTPISSHKKAIGLLNQAIAQLDTGAKWATAHGK
jgi:hypothetical protein